MQLDSQGKLELRDLLESLVRLEKTEILEQLELEQTFGLSRKISHLEIFHIQRPLSLTMISGSIPHQPDLAVQIGSIDTPAPTLRGIILSG